MWVQRLLSDVANAAANAQLQRERLLTQLNCRRAEQV